MKKTTSNDQMALDETGEGEILDRLSERVEKAVSTINELRRERDQLRTRVADLESSARENDEASSRLESLEEEHERLRKERTEIRDRIEAMLANLEALEGE